MDDFLKKTGDFLKSLPVIGPVLDDAPKVCMVRLSGVIADAAIKKRGSFSHARVAGFLDKAFGKKPVAVALVINCPGGAPAQTSLIASHIRRLAEEKDVPVFAFVEDVAASGGYWLACAADEIHAQETSIVGSIGVISASFGLQQFIAKHGIERRVHTSGEEKSFLDPFLPERAEDVSRLHDIQREMHDVFRDWVTVRRGEKLKGSDKSLFEGAIFTGASAVGKGLIDGIADMESFMKEKFGDKVRFIDCSPDRAFLPWNIPFAGQGGENIAENALAALENRAFWGRFGL